MKKLTIEQQKIALLNFLRLFDPTQKYFITKADGRIGKKFAIAEFAEPGAINIKSNFMTYEEMNCYFMGILAIMENRINL